MNVVLFSIIFLLLMLVSKKSGSESNALFYLLIILYLLSFISTILLDVFFVKQIVQFVPVLFLLVILFLFFIPFKNIPVPYIATTNRNICRINRFSIMMIFLTIIPTIYFAYYAFRNLTSVNLSSFRIDVSEGSVSILPQGFLNSVFVLIAPLYFINLIMFFISFLIESKSFIKSGLFITSFVFVLFTLCYEGRDGIIFWFFNFMALFLFFRNILAKEEKKMIIKASAIVTILFLFIFLLITFKRFVSSGYYNENETTVSTILNYYGQQLGNYSKAFYLNIDYNTTIFPGIRKYLFGSFSSEKVKHLLHIQRAENADTVFGFFVKDLIWGYSYLGTICISIFYFFITNSRKKALKRNNRLSDFIILILLFQIPLCGVFYFRQMLGITDFSYIFGFLLTKFYFNKIRIL
jgi:hypothetical protein